MSKPRVQLVIEYVDHQFRYYSVDRGWRICSASRCIVIGRMPRTYIPLDAVMSFTVEAMSEDS